MRTSITLLFAPWILGILLSACDGEHSSPTSATPTPAQTPALTYTLSGAVSELTPAGFAGIQGALVVVNIGRVATTDANGHYVIPGLSATSRFVSVSRFGYVSATHMMTMTGDTQLDIRLDRMASYTLSGVVFEITEAGRVPLKGVEVYCDSCGSPDGHTFVQTDANGFYSLAWAINGVHPLFVTKPGYEIVDRALLDGLGRIRATVDGDTRFDVELVRQ
jgi:Carboxypeptidase regulatory-like domain